MSFPVSLRVTCKSSPHTPHTELIFRTEGENAEIVDARLVLDGVETKTIASNDIFELTYRYREKSVSRAVLRIGDTEYVDSDGDGRPDLSGQDGGQNTTTYAILAAAFPNLPRAQAPPLSQSLFSVVPDLSGSAAMAHTFRASCGSLAAVIHELRGHSLLWASVPPGSAPNEVHRHIGGPVYCIFYRGSGRFHRVSPGGFETLPIEITDENPFHMIAIADHLWYQPINTGTQPLEYLMIHAPNFEQSEMLTLKKSECRPGWGFEW